MSFQFKVLRAEHGDCIIISGIFENVARNILIDGGPSKTFKSGSIKGELLKELEVIRNLGQKVDLLILTHIDDDHIGGLLKGFKDNEILAELTKKVWFNSGSLIKSELNLEMEGQFLTQLESEVEAGQAGFTSVRQGVSFEEKIDRLMVWHKQLIKAPDTKELFGIKFTLLSPTTPKLEALLNKWNREEPSSLTGSSQGDYDKTLADLLSSTDTFEEDDSVHNGSSIAFILEYVGKKVLFLGDAHNEVIVSQLTELGYSSENPLQVDFVKLSHHGSKYNTSNELLGMLDCKQFIVSSNTNRFKLPNKVTLMRIIKNKPHCTIFFNYPEIIRQKIFDHDEISLIESFGVSLESCEYPFEL